MQFILDSVVDSLLVIGDRKIIYVEIAFFSRWWRRLNPERRNVVVGSIARLKNMPHGVTEFRVLQMQNELKKIEKVPIDDGTVSPIG